MPCGSKLAGGGVGRGPRPALVTQGPKSTGVSRQLSSPSIIAVHELDDAERGHTAPATRRRCDPVLHFMLFLIHA